MACLWLYRKSVAEERMQTISCRLESVVLHVCVFFFFHGSAGLDSIRRTCLSNFILPVKCQLNVRSSSSFKSEIVCSCLEVHIQF